nr:hypothetical protein [Escherichia coli]
MEAIPSSNVFSTKKAQISGSAGDRTVSMNYISSVTENGCLTVTGRLTVLPRFTARKCSDELARILVHSARSDESRWLTNGLERALGSG